MYWPFASELFTYSIQWQCSRVSIACACKTSKALNLRVKTRAEKGRDDKRWYTATVTLGKTVVWDCVQPKISLTACSKRVAFEMVVYFTLGRSVISVYIVASYKTATSWSQWSWVPYWKATSQRSCATYMSIICTSSPICLRVITLSASQAGRSWRHVVPHQVTYGIKSSCLFAKITLQGLIFPGC